MSDCNCFFIIETGVFVEWMTPTGKTYYINDFENRGDCNSLFQRKTVPLKKCEWPLQMMMVPLIYMATSAALQLQYALKK